MHLNKYARKILSRFALGAGGDDLGVICDLKEKGLLTIDNMKTDRTLESSEMRITITQAGRYALAAK